MENETLNGKDRGNVSAAARARPRARATHSAHMVTGYMCKVTHQKPKGILYLTPAI